MNKTFLKKSILLLLTLVMFSSCEKEDLNNGNNNNIDDDDDSEYWEEELDKMTKISVGEPFFTVSPGTPLNIHRVAWTGEKLWAITGIGGGDIPQKLLEINISNGNIIQSIPFNEPDNPTKQMFSLDYANGKLWDIDVFFLPTEQKYAKTYDTTTGEATDQWNYSGNYDLYYYLTFDGTHYWGGTNYTLDGYNCQAIVSYDVNGNVIKAFKMCDNNFEDFPYGNDCEDLVYGGGYLWASRKFGNYKVISKLDLELNILENYHLTDGNKFGETQYSNEIAVHLEYINGTLWIVDRSNNFYKTTIQ